MTGVYQVGTPKDSKALAKYQARDGRLLLPVPELIIECRIAVIELIEAVRRTALEAVLCRSAGEFAGALHPGKF